MLAPVANESEWRPVVGMGVFRILDFGFWIARSEQLQRRFAQCGAFGVSGLDIAVERGHKQCGCGVVYRPLAYHLRRYACREERPGQPYDPLACPNFASSGVTGGEHD